MKNFTTLSFILSMLSLASVNAANPEVKDVNLDLVGLDHLTKSLGLEETIDLGRGKGKKKGGLKLASEGGDEIQEAQAEENEEDDTPAESETIKAAGDSGNYFGGHHYHGRHHGRGYGHGYYGWSHDGYPRGYRRHWRNNGIYRRAEEKVGHGRKHGYHGHRRHGHDFDHDDSDWSDDDSDWHGSIFHGTHGGLHRRAEEAEAGYSRGHRLGHHGYRRYGRFHGHYDSDWSDCDSDWYEPRHHGRRFHGRKHGLYRRAEEGRHVGRSKRHNSYGQIHHFDSDSDFFDSDYSDKESDHDIIRIQKPDSKPVSKRASKLAPKLSKPKKLVS